MGTVAPSAFLEDRGRAAASWKVANAGVDGLLARPLFVVTGALGGAGGTDSLLRSCSSGLVSFLVLADVGAEILSRRSASFFVGSTLTGTLASLTTLTSSAGRTGLLAGAAAVAGGGAVTVAAKSGVAGALPLGLFDADDEGRVLAASAAADCSEF